MQLTIVLRVYQLLLSNSPLLSFKFKFILEICKVGHLKKHVCLVDNEIIFQ